MVGGLVWGFGIGFGIGFALRICSQYARMLQGQRKRSAGSQKLTSGHRDLFRMHKKLYKGHARFFMSTVIANRLRSRERILHAAISKRQTLPEGLKARFRVWGFGVWFLIGIRLNMTFSHSIITVL